MDVDEESEAEESLSGAQGILMEEGTDSLKTWLILLFAFSVIIFVFSP